MATALRAVSVDDLDDEVRAQEEAVEIQETEAYLNDYGGPVDEDGSVDRIDEAGEADEADEADEDGEESSPPVPAELAPPSNNDLSLLQQWANDVQEKQRGRAAYLQEIDRAKRELKSAKTELEEYDAELFDFISRGPYQPTLFDQPNINHPADQPEPPHPVDPDATPEIPVDDAKADEAVKLSTPIVELGLPKGIESALLEAGLSSVGEIATFTEQGNDLTDIKGIGEGKAERIRNAMASLWE